MKNKKNPMVAAALAGMIGAAFTISTVTQAKSPPKGENVPCYGVNECGGKGSFCGVPGANSCHGKNSCKGKGLIQMEKSECLKKGGQVADAAWKKKMEKAAHKG
ncbi:MAG: hypothetical protein H6617_04825 [Bdellovibrionaceae bacterium]|nr:hypothetical protein [Bdellovibrionales bacterium]MCB9253986.1 hypothetical protein [Pseudobdellovibrionaceae bacterium]